PAHARLEAMGRCADRSVSELIESGWKLRRSGPLEQRQISSIASETLSERLGPLKRAAKHNFALGEQPAPQDGHSCPKVVPHSSQKTESTCLEAPQAEQFTARVRLRLPPRGSARRSR